MSPKPSVRHVQNKLGRRPVHPAGRRQRSAAVYPAAFTLLEIIIAMAIFFVAAAALSQLVLVGVRSARWAELVNEATLRCESELAALAGRLKPLQSRQPTAFSDDPNWGYEIEVVPTGVPNLYRVTVTVRHYRDADWQEADVEVSLAQLIASESTGEASGVDSLLGPTGDTQLMPATALPASPTDAASGPGQWP